MMIMTVIWSFLAFDFVYVLTQGGPPIDRSALDALVPLRLLQLCDRPGAASPW